MEVGTLSSHAALTFKLFILVLPYLFEPHSIESFYVPERTKINHQPKTSTISFYLMLFHRSFDLKRKKLDNIADNF